MDAARAASASAAAASVPVPPAAAAAGSRATRGLRVDEYSRAQSGVWYYQVDIELRYGSGSSSSLARDAAFAHLDTCEEDDVQCYSVRRRYNEFAQLYDKIKDEIVAAAAADDAPHAIGDSGLPPFPQKELISSSVLGMLWRVSAPTYVLEDRRAKFEALLRWIEHHPMLRESQAYLDFLGQPPQVSEGYVSLKEYSSQNWLSSLEKLTKDKAKRRRRLSSDCSAMLPEAPRSSKKRRQADRDSTNDECALVLADAPREPTKRPRRLAGASSPHSPARSAATPRQKTRARRRSASTSDDTPCLLLCGDVDTVAQVEGSHAHMKKKKRML